jgi:hypothetical protein
MVKEVIYTSLLYLLSTAFSLTGGVLGGMLYFKHSSTAPQVVVLDMRRLVEPLALDPHMEASEQRRRVEDMSRRASELIDAYAAKGAIVLDASAVLRAPQKLYVQP